MRKLLPLLLVPSAIGLAIAAAAVSGGCGLMNSDLTIDLPTQTFPFEVNANQLKGELEANCQCSIPGSEIPAGVNIKETFPIEIPAQQTDLSTQPALQKYVSASKVKAVKIKFMRYTVSQNSLNFNLPSADLYLANLNATSTADPSAKKVAFVPSIQAGNTSPGEVKFTDPGAGTEGGREVMSRFLLDLKFAFLGKANVTVDTSVTRAVPGGVIKGEVQVGLQFVVDPL